jgi:hypothetical protein
MGVSSHFFLQNPIFFWWGGGKDGVITILRINFRIRNDQIIKEYKYKILQGFLTKFYCFSGFFNLKKILD